MTAPFVSLPPRSERASLFILVVMFGVTFALLYGVSSAWSEFVPWRMSVALPVDETWPFWPAAAGIYLTITPMLLLAPFVLRDLASLLPLYVTLMLETAIAAACFLLLPVDGPATDCCEGTVSGALFRVADAMNLERNCFPSLHVAFACTAALAFAPRASRAGAVSLHVWAAAVAMSTLVTKQHFLVDVVAGYALALACWRFSKRWAARPRVLAAFDVELLCLRNFGRFIRRHRRYLVITIAVLAAGIPRWWRQRLVRTGFAFLQATDDLLDGDRPSEREPLEITDELIASLESGHFADDELARLGAAFRADLLARGGPAALATAIQLLRRMQRDRRRMLSREISTSGELEALHAATFGPGLDLMLVAADSTLRSTDVPELVTALGWCSSVRDLQDDLRLQLVNVPSDVVEEARAEAPDMPLASIGDTIAVRRWLSQEKAGAVSLLDRAEMRIRNLGSVRGAGLLMRFARSMRRYTA